MNLHTADQVVRKLRAMEAQAGQALNAALGLEGDLEGDAHGVRCCYISKDNPHFATAVAKAQARFKPGSPVVKVWKLWVRLAGLGARSGSGGKLAIAMLPPNLVVAEGPPPPEETKEVAASGLLQKAVPRKSLLNADGSAAWKAAARLVAPHLLHRNVVHSQNEYTRKVRTPPGFSNVTGTQCVDSRWNRLDDYIPNEVTTKVGKKVNPELLTYIWTWVWRFNRDHNEDLQTALGRLCRESR